MKAVQTTDNINCIHTPASCVEWNYGSIEYLGICNGDMLPEIVWEIVNKLQEIAGQDLSSFDIDVLLTICNQKAPLEKNLITILELLRDNQVCLKDYIDTLVEQIAELSKDQEVDVNLKCLADFDNFGNQLSVTREQLDQIVIDKLCNHEDRILTVEGKVTSLQNQINNIDLTADIQEPEFATCVDAVIKPTSSQVISVANEVCDIRTKLGPNTASPDISVGSFANKAPYWNSSVFNTVFGTITGWIPSPTNEVEYQRNIYLIINNFQSRLAEIETNCCAPSCDKITIGFSVTPGTNPMEYILNFRATDGNNLFGFTDNGSTVNFKDADGTMLFVTPVPIDVTKEDDTNSYFFNNVSFDTKNPVTVILTARLIKNGLSCEKCISTTIYLDNSCPVCEVTSSGTGTVTITYSVPDAPAPPVT